MGFISFRGRDSFLQIPPPPQGFVQGLNLSGIRNPGGQEKNRFMVSWVPYRNRVAGEWFRHEKPLRFRAGPAGSAGAATSAVRRDIFVEPQPKQNISPVGAAYSDVGR
jgi:hypothetical protein